MKDIYQVLSQREADILRVRREIEALRLVIPLLADENARHMARSDPSLLPLARPTDGD